MATEVWFRNPHSYIRQLAEVGGKTRIVWDRGMLVKKRIEAVGHAKLYLGVENDFEILAVGEQGTAHLDKDHDLTNPLAVYPTWSYGQDNTDILEEMISSPIGMDAEACESDVAVDELPVFGQDHRVVITNMPNAHVTANRPFYRMLRDLQEEYPECKITLHGSYSYRIMFGMGFFAADVEPRQDAAQGRVVLPNGKKMAYARTIGQQQWVNVLGMSVIDLKVPTSRCIFNIKSALWAGEHFTEDIKFKSQGKSNVDPDSPVKQLPTAANRMSTPLQAVEGDMVTCDTCNLSDNCKLSREGAVCSVQGSETNSLAKMFASRDSGKIIDGLGKILESQSKRLERGMESEEEFGELDPEVTKIMNQLFSNGVKLAKLIDPALTKPLVQINNSNTQAVAGASPKELGATVIRELEAQGIPREQITPQMFESMLLKMTGGPAPAPPPIPAISVEQIED